MNKSKGALRTRLFACLPDQKKSVISEALAEAPG
jgi:hypothetical protein